MALFLAALCGPFATPFPAPAQSAAQSKAFEFHGLRIGMRLAEIEALGYRATHVSDTSISSSGYALEGALPPGLHALTVYLFNHRLFQFDATYLPARGAAAATLMTSLYAKFDAPPEIEQKHLHDARWTAGGMTFHLSPGVQGDAGLMPNLLVTEEATYRYALEMKRNPPRNGGM